jgi:hypothetical protein
MGIAIEPPYYVQNTIKILVKQGFDILGIDRYYIYLLRYL